MVVAPVKFCVQNQIYEIFKEPKNDLLMPLNY